MSRPPSVPTRQIITIFMFVGLLVASFVLKSRCSRSVGNMFKVLDAPVGDAGARRD